MLVKLTKKVDIIYEKSLKENYADKLIWLKVYTLQNIDVKNLTKR